MRLSSVRTWWYREAGLVGGALIATAGAVTLLAVLLSGDRSLPALVVSLLFLLGGSYGAYRANRLADVWLDPAYLQIKRRRREWQVLLSDVVAVREQRWWVWISPCVVIRHQGAGPSPVFFYPAMLRELGSPPSIAQELQAAVAAATVRSARAGA